MVYINSRGEVVDDTVVSRNPVTILWKVINFFVLFFKSMVGFSTKPDKKDDGNSGRSGSISGGFYGGGGGSGGGGSKPSNNSKGPRKFGPRGFKSVTDLAPPPTPMACGSGGCCG